MTTTRRPIVSHGVSGYIAGCRCKICSDAELERQFEVRLVGRLERLRERFDLEDWQVDLQREALRAKRRREMLGRP